MLMLFGCGALHMWLELAAAVKSCLRILIHWRNKETQATWCSVPCKDTAIRLSPETGVKPLDFSDLWTRRSTVGCRRNPEGLKSWVNISCWHVHRYKIEALNPWETAKAISHVYQDKRVRKSFPRCLSESEWLCGQTLSTRAFSSISVFTARHFSPIKMPYFPVEVEVVAIKSRYTQLSDSSFCGFFSHVSILSSFPHSCSHGARTQALRVAECNILLAPPYDI